MNKLNQWWDKLSQQWDKLPLSRKLAQVLLPLVVIGTIFIMVFLNFVFHVSFLNKDNDVTGWGSLLIGSDIGIYITFAILFYSDASQKRTSDIIEQQEEFRKKHREVAMTIIGKNLLGQTSILASLQRRQGKNNTAVNLVTGEKFNTEEHDERALQLNNMELKMILASSSGILDSELLKKLLHFSSQFDFLEKFKPYITERGEWMHLTLIEQIIREYFPELLKEFKGFGGSTTETHDSDQTHKS